ncbi:hypothetical protein BDZ91DRAFT_321346 [Kalaharituber pfeilii]|nr:hypothetical protein BDZ91DRAFT_321346 [Kalaharituber pfeilii]
MTIIVDTGSVSAFNKERAVKEKGKEKDRGKQTLATLSLRPSQDATVEQIPSPRLIGTTAINKIASTSNFQSEKLPAEKIADWALNVPLSEDVEGKRVTTVSMFIHKGMNENRLTIAQPGLESIKNKESQTETRDEFVQGQAMASAGERASNTVPPERKKSKATRMADCLNGIKSRYGSTSTKETTLAPSPAAGITVAQITATAPKPAKSKRPASRPETKSSPPTTTNTNTAQKPAKFKAPVPSPETKRSSPMRTYTTTASGAISNQPLKGETKKPRRTKSLRAFFRYFEEERPRSASRMRSQSTPASKSSNFSPVTPASPIRRPTTSPTVGTRSPAAIKRGGKTQNSSRPASPRNPASGKQRTGTTDTVAPNAKRAALLKASLD